MNKSSYLLPTALVLVAVATGVVTQQLSSNDHSGDTTLTQMSSDETHPTSPAKSNKPHSQKKSLHHLSGETTDSSSSIDASKLTQDSDSPFAIPGEKVLSFASLEDLESFLEKNGSRGLQVLGRSNQLNSLLVQARSLASADLDELDFETSSNFFLNPPLDFETVAAQANAVAVGGGLLNQVGIGTDNSTWGEGVTVAVIDSGITAHSALPSFETIITSSFEDMLTQKTEGNTALQANSEGELAPEFHGHGTAVASIIAGLGDIAPGIAPASTLLSIPITNATGSSTSFALADGIIAAVDAGAQILNVSLGSYGNSPLVARAVNYASENGAIIVASSGNEGLDFSAYPSAYPNVISVGAVDGTGAHVNFSNASDDLSVTAPGFQVNTAWLDDQFILSSGTSFSAPAVAGAISAVMSNHPQLSTVQAAQIVLDHTNDAGAPGPDNLLGNGHLDVGRAVNYNTPNIVDPAIASHYIAPADNTSSRDQVLVTIQNQGTTELNSVPITVTTNTGEHKLESGFIPPGDTETFHLPLNFVPLLNGGSVQIRSRIDADAFQNDNEPSNNGLSTTLSLPAEEQP